MGDERYAGLSDKRAILQVLGCLMLNPALSDDSDKPIDAEDFNTEAFYKIIFVAIFNLHQRGVVNISECEIDSYLSTFPEQYKIFQANKGLDWISDAMDMAQPNNYDYWYHRVRKFSLLRYYEKSGLDTRIIYDGNQADANSTTEENLRFDKLTEQDIVEFVENIFTVEAKNRYCNSYAVVSAQAGDGMKAMIAELMEVPDYGYSLSSLAFNTAARGGRLGKLYLMSAGTGVGKTRNYLMNACAISVPYQYDTKQNCFFYTGQCVPCLFIGTEGSVEEFQSIILATVSKVDEDHILMGNYAEGEYERVQKAEEYISASPLYLVYCDEFTIADIENLIKQYILQKGIEVAFFDYIQTTAKMMGDLTARVRIKLQEYQVLVQFAGRLKALAEKNNILIVSGSQLRPDAKDARYKDETCLQGAKGMAQKADVGAVWSRPTPSEKQKIEKITRHMVMCPEVNLLLWVYKVRRGRLVSIIIHQHINLGTMQVQDLFVTDFDFNLIDIDFTKIEQMDKVVEEKSRKLELDKISDDIITEGMETIEEDDGEETEVIQAKQKIIF